MAKTLIGNVRGKDGRGISKIEKTATTGAVDTYTISYTDGTESTYEVKNSDNVAIQRQIVPSAAVESSTTASQAYAAGDYVVVGGVLRKVKSSITKGSTIGDSNSTATTVTGEIKTVQDSVSPVSFKSKVVFASNETVAHSYFIVCGNMVFIFYQGAIKTHVKGDILFTVPKKYAPKLNNQIIAPFVKNSDAYGNVSIEDDGICKVGQISSTTANGRIYFQMCYPLTV